MLSLLGYRLFNQPEICSGDQSRISLRATISRSFLFGKQAGLGPHSQLPGLPIGFTGSI